MGNFPETYIDPMFIFTVALLPLLEDLKLFSWMSPPREWTPTPDEAPGICY